MSTQLGIWSDAAGGFIDSGFYRESDAEASKGTLVLQGEDRGDLKVLELCPDHEEQPYDDCEECMAEDEGHADVEV